MYRRLLMVFALVCCSMWLFGCVSSVPSSRSVYKADNVTPATLAGKRIVLVMDIRLVGSLSHDKREYVSVFDSRRALEKCARAISTYMNVEGLTEPQPVLLVVGELPEIKGEVPVCEYPLGKVQTRMPPFWMNKEWSIVSGDRAVELAHDLLAPIKVVFGKKPDRFSELPEGAAFRAALQELKGRYDCDYVVLIDGCGKFVSVAERMKAAAPEAIATAVISGILSGGTVIVSTAQVPISHFVTRVVLVDASTGQLMFSNAYPPEISETYRLVADAFFGPRTLDYDPGRAEHYNNPRLEKIADGAVRSHYYRRCNHAYYDWAVEVFYHLIHREETEDHAKQK